jgi:1,4-alpha-glucan branching enzyme
LRTIVVNEHVCGGVEFRFYRREARQVFLCGDFNDWHQTSLPMTVMDGGWWKCRLHLAPGSYRFKYLADSEWYPDYAAFGLEMGPLATWNSVVLVSGEPEDAEPRLAPLADIAMPRRPSQVFFGPPDGHGLRRSTNETANDGREVLA